MSHFTKVQVQIRSAKEIIECLKEMGYQIMAVKEITGYRGKKEKVDFAVNTEGYSIGFRRNNDGIYEILADWWGVRGTTQDEFTSKLRIAYAEKKVRKFAQRKGFRLIEESAESGKQFLLVRRNYG